MSWFRCRSAVPAIVLIASIGCLPSSIFASIIITDATTYADVVDNNPFASSFSVSYDHAGESVTASLPGFSSTHNSVYGQSGFSHTVNQARQSGLLDSSYGEAKVYFTAQNNIAYSISGSYTNSAGFGEIFAYLYHHNSNSYIYLNSSNFDGQATMNLAGPGLNGSLIAGDLYQWGFSALTQSYGDADPGAAASGTISIQFSSALPEPSSLLVWGALGLVGLAVGRRRRF